MAGAVAVGWGAKAAPQVKAAYARVRSDVIGMIDGPFSKVLDVGCSDGATGRALKSMGRPRVVGLDIDPEAVRRCQGVYDAAHVANLDDGIPDVGRFDLIILPDVLEHLKRPDLVLSRLVRDHLEPGGTVIVSLPNIQNWWALWTIARGRFPRAESGLWDATHLRWFTRHEAERMISEAGLRVVRMRRVLKVSEGRSGRPLHPLLTLFGPLFTAQMVFALEAA